MNQEEYFFFNPSNGSLILDKGQTANRLSTLLLVLNRKQLLFHELYLETKKQPNLQQVLSIQSNFLPFERENFLNIIYQHKDKNKKSYFSWFCQLSSEEKGRVFDEIPESLLFKGDPKLMGNYNIFVFRRVSGFEIIYFNHGKFFSLFESDQSQILEMIISLKRRFLKQEKPRILSDVDFDLNGERMEVDHISEDARYYLLSDHSNLTKFFSNITQDKQARGLNEIIRKTNKFFKFFLGFFSVTAILNLIFFVYLKVNHSDSLERFTEVQNLLDQTEKVELRILKIKNYIARYPDHLLWLEKISDSLDPESQILEYSLNQNRILIKGLSSNSLELLKSIRDNDCFQEVGFKSPVNKNIYSKKERFEINIIPKTTYEKI